MHEVSFDAAVELIRAKDPRYARDAYRFVREALDHTQKTLAKDTRGRMRHVRGQELLAGIRAFALAQFGPMAMMVLEEWGIQACKDFGEIVFNMVETGSCSAFILGDFPDLPTFTARLAKHSDPVSEFVWRQLSEATRKAAAIGVLD